ncbi:hypothetical protein ODZ83_04000 [Acaricomes phytoseiuli]|uniref:hypothetical protein n=1 Tax=Acaricomes phytoseiuli TaxID=291968 RepID=UPI0012EA469A|nr:hypothetical protein [Acaricomes phytoseiuli]MCW1249357.1 hypothetical protein [Acaricomes phytoseiuli]
MADAPHRLGYTWHTMTDEFRGMLGLTEEEFAPQVAEQRSAVTFELELPGD